MGHIESHGKAKAGSSTLEDFFAWALKLCQRDETNRVMVETPDFRVTWDAPKTAAKRRVVQPRKRKA